MSFRQVAAQQNFQIIKYSLIILFIIHIYLLCNSGRRLQSRKGGWRADSGAGGGGRRGVPDRGPHAGGRALAAGPAPPR